MFAYLYISVANKPSYILVLFQGMHTEMHSTPAIKSLGLSKMIWWGCKWGHWGVKDHFQSIKFGIRKKWGTKALVTCKKFFEKWDPTI